jgi:hypothetical protein
VHLRPDGSQTLYTGATADLPEGLRPNGIALERDGAFLIANLGSEAGGVWRLDRQGQVRPVLVEIDGSPIPPSNFCTRDGAGRLWLTVSSRRKPRSLDYPARRGERVHSDDGCGRHPYRRGRPRLHERMRVLAGRGVAVRDETYGRRLSRFPLCGYGGLGDKEVVSLATASIPMVSPSTWPARRVAHSPRYAQ